MTQAEDRTGFPTQALLGVMTVMALFTAAGVAGLAFLPGEGALRFVMAVALAWAVGLPAILLLQRASPAFRRRLTLEAWTGGPRRAAILGALTWGLPMGTLMAADRIIHDGAAAGPTLAVHIAWWMAAGALFGLVMRTRTQRDRARPAQSG